jgi:parvulin-like peptidyl-prolyl isomerase
MRGLLALLLLAVPPAAPQGGENGSGGEGTEKKTKPKPYEQAVFTVNDRAVTGSYLKLRMASAMKKLDALRAARKREGRWGKQEDEFYEKTVENLRRQVVREVVFTEILRSHAEYYVKLGFSVPSRRVEMHVRMRLRQAGGPAELARRHGLSVAALRDMAKDELLAMAYRQMMHVQMAEPTPQEIADYYKFKSEDFRRPESVRARVIFIKRFVYDERTGRNLERKTARKRAEGLLARLKSGEDFAKLARRYSENPESAAAGGLLGSKKKGYLVGRRRYESKLDAALFGGKPGKLSGVVEGPQNYYIVKVITHLPEGVPPLDEIEDLVRRRCFAARVNRAEAKLFRECYKKVLVRDARGRRIPMKEIMPRPVRLPRRGLFEPGT